MASGKTILAIVSLIIIIFSVVVLVDVGRRLFGGGYGGGLSTDSVDLTLVDCQKVLSDTMEINVRLSNSNDREVIVEWHAFGQDSQGNFHSGVEGYAKIPARSTVSDKNYVDTLSSTEGCIVRIVSVTGTWYEIFFVCCFS